MEVLVAYGYIGVFVASFLAATVLPFSSEAVLTGVLLAGAEGWPCFVGALVGNSLGGMTCYWVGSLGKVEWVEKYLRMESGKLARIAGWVQRRGVWSAFFVFLPGVGDFIAVALGFLRAKVLWVVLFMVLGKALRYWVWMEFVFKVQGLL
ncbi:MAG: DedA family protein [Tannerellaceae bacterium]|jgi:membrane protein YqaA with SNARE-associated domain|nr:DedA family protein [Tannerellaceae bacterium]